jgi:ribosomal protein S18 acetylase RimI-like enzyme
MSITVNIAPLEEADLEAAACILATSFKDYAVMRYMFNDSGDSYEAHVTEFFFSLYQLSLANNWPIWGVKANHQWVAAAIAYNSNASEVSPGTDEQYKHFYSTLSPETSRLIGHYEQQADKAHPIPPHYFIDSLGTLPGHQGKGYAKSLLAEYQELSQRDKHSTGVGLNTESANNLPFYQNLGYEIIAKQSIESLTSWSLFRADN